MNIYSTEFTPIYSTEFTPTKDHDRSACEAWVAIWNDGGRHVAIAAPTLDQLQLAWLRITNLDLIVDRAQHVFFVKVEP